MGTSGFSNEGVKSTPGPQVSNPNSPMAGAKPRRTPLWVWIVVGVAVGFIGLLVLMLLAIPTLGTMKRHANETSAINSLQAIAKAEIQYDATYPANGYACSLATLGGDPSAGPPSAASAQLLPEDLASGFKNGYMFSLACGGKVTVNDVDRYSSFTVMATPRTVGRTGDRGFCADESGEIKVDPTGGVNCTQPIQ